MSPTDRQARAARARATLEQYERIASRIQDARTLEDVNEIYDQLDTVLNTGLATALGCSVAEIRAAVALIYICDTLPERIWRWAIRATEDRSRSLR